VAVAATPESEVAYLESVHAPMKASFCASAGLMVRRQIGNCAQHYCERLKREGLGQTNTVHCTNCNCRTAISKFLNRRIFLASPGLLSISKILRDIKL
jgi:hypothetical protein